MNEFIAKIAAILEAAPGALTADTALAGIEGWDSLAVISFVALCDKDYGRKPTGTQISAAKTIRDLYSLVA